MYLVKVQFLIHRRKKIAQTGNGVTYFLKITEENVNTLTGAKRQNEQTGAKSVRPTDGHCESGGQSKLNYFTHCEYTATHMYVHTPHNSRNQIANMLKKKPEMGCMGKFIKIKNAEEQQILKPYEDRQLKGWMLRRLSTKWGKDVDALKGHTRAYT